MCTGNSPNTRKVLYKLQEKNLIKLEQEKTRKKGFYNYKWKLTEKAQEIIKKNEKLRKIKDFYKLCEELLKK